VEHDLGGASGQPMDPCPSAEAVERLLSSDEAEELASFPTLSGCYFDRRSQRMVLPERSFAWAVDPHKPLAEVVAQCTAEHDDRLRRCAQVTEESRAHADHPIDSQLICVVRIAGSREKAS